MSYPYYYVLDEEGKARQVQDGLEWARWFENARNRTVLETEIADGIRVSTVFLGIDHRLTITEGLPPILWETMIFGGEHDQDQWRYTSLPKAIEGHGRAVRIAKGEQEEEPEPAGYWLPADHTLKLTAYELGALRAILMNAEGSGIVGEIHVPGPNGEPVPSTFVQVLADKCDALIKATNDVQNDVQQEDAR